MKYNTGEVVNCGDVVRLKHGGMHMTIEQVGIDGSPVDAVTAVWFDVDNHLKRNSFAVLMLELISR